MTLFLKSLISLFVCCFLSSCASLNSRSLDHTEPRQFVILKLDDYRADVPVTKGWSQTFEFLNQNNVIGTLGIIGEGLEKQNVQSIEWLLRQNAIGHEIWNHGYCHCRQEVNGQRISDFRGRNLANQKEDILRVQKLAREKIGLTLTTFGAPYNATDDNTALALSSAKMISVWLFKDTDDDVVPTTLTQLKRIKSVNIEYPVHNPDFEAFKKGFEAHRDKSVLVIQGHPNSWVNDPERFNEFKKIILFLKNEGAEFLAPRTYEQSKTAA